MNNVNGFELRSQITLYRQACRHVLFSGLSPRRTVTLGLSFDVAQILHLLVSQEAADAFKMFFDTLVSEFKNFVGKTIQEVPIV
jgi:hypothetical protein